MKENGTEVYLALGGNLGDRAANLRRAVREIKKIAAVEKVSSVYESKPRGFAAQPDFYNAALRARTVSPPHELLKELKDIETRLGRTPSFKNGPRVIDIDIIFYGGVVLDGPELTLPHPRAAERAFVYEPLAEIGLNIKRLDYEGEKTLVKIRENLLGC